MFTSQCSDVFEILKQAADVFVLFLVVLALDLNFFVNKTFIYVFSGSALFFVLFSSNLY